MKKAIKYTDEPIKARIIKDFLPAADKLRFADAAVKVTYDTHADTLRFRLRGAPIAGSDQVGRGVVVDYDARGAVMGIKVLHASKRAVNPKALEFAVA